MRGGGALPNLPGWTGQACADRALGWTPAVTLDQALAELNEGLGGAAPKAPD